MKYIFPKNFWWGSATSGPQSEGTVQGDGKSKNIWDYWFEIAPERFFDGVGPQHTSTFYQNYKQDIQLLKDTILLEHLYSGVGLYQKVKEKSILKQ